MAKKAGAKNDGAWFRSNEAIHYLSAPEKAALAQQIAGLATHAAAFEAMQQIAAAAGLSDLAGIPANEADYATKLVQSGIPRQVWMGVLTYDTYEKNGEDQYKAVHAEAIRLYAIELRQAVREFLFLRRQVRDLFDIGGQGEGNPGGNPDGAR